jgi:hypothetical protein
LTTHNYAKLLDCIGVKRSDQTNNRLIEEATEELSAASITSSTAIASPVLQPKKKDEDDEETPKLPQQEDEDADHNSTQYSSSTMSDHFQTPEKKASGVGWNATSSFASPTGSTVAFTPTRFSKKYSVMQWKEPLQGTQEDPFVIYADPRNAHATREFDIAFVPMKLVKGFRRNCVQI